MNKVTQQEIIDILSEVKFMVLDNSEPYHKLQKLIGRIKNDGILQPVGYVSIDTVLGVLPKLNNPDPRDSIEYHLRYKQFNKDMEWVRERIVKFTAKEST